MDDTKKRLNKVVGISFVVFFGIALISVFAVNMKDNHKEGYFRYEDTYYYHYDNHFYYYDDYEEDWSKYAGDFAEDVDDYYVDDDWDSGSSWDSNW